MKIRDVFFAALSGILTALAFPKFSLFFLGWVSLIPFLALVLNRKPRQSFLLGLVAGLAFYALLLYWIPDVPAHYGSLSPVLSFLIYLVLILFLALFWAFFGLVASRIRMSFPGSVYFLIPFVWVSFEYLITHLFTGFPWGLLGYSQQRNVYLIQTAAVTGVYGVSFVLIFFQSLFLASMKERRKSPFFSALALVILLHSAGYWVVRPVSPNDQTFRASVIQGNVSSDIYWDRVSTNLVWELFERHIDLTRRAAAEGARFVVWPEFTVPLCFSCPEDVYRELESRIIDLVRETGVSLLVGTNEALPSGDRIRYFNTALHIDKNLGMTQYHKMHLVPFGEYTPYPKFFSFINKMTHAIGDISPGREHRLHRLNGLAFGSPICYEIIFPDLVRRFAAKGARFLTTITNDGWYGTTSAPYQHFGMAVFRAVENRRFLLRAATTGVSGIIDPYGRVVHRSQMETVDVLTADVTPVQSMTPYSRFGDVLPWVSLTLSLLCLILTFLKKRKNER